MCLICFPECLMCFLCPALCHELAFFTFFSLLFYCIDTCCYSPKSYFKHRLTLLINHSVFLLCFRPSTKSKRACIQSHNVANTTLKLQRTARFKARRKQQGYLIVRENDRTRDPLQDRRIGTIAHQRAYQGITFQGIHRNAQL